MMARFPLHISYFTTATPRGPALGYPRDTTWGRFCDALQRRREGDKDGANFMPARFTPEPRSAGARSAGMVRRVGANLIARTAVALDIETNPKTGEIPPELIAAVGLVRQTGWAAVIYSSHNHTAAAPRYRIVLPLSEEVDPGLPAPEVVADRLRLSGVLDRGKVAANSLFYMPSCKPGQLGQHATEVIDGAPVDAAWLRDAAGQLQQQMAAEAHAQADARRQSMLAAGNDPDDSLIEKIRERLDLEQILLSHGYDKRGHNYRHPNSTSGSYGADIKMFGGIERVYSHNANDPLHRGNLPSWCTIAAVDVVDAVIILYYGSNRKKALHDLAKRYGLDKKQERKQLRSLLFRLIRQQAEQAHIETAAFATGQRLGLSKTEVIEVANWVASEALKRARMRTPVLRRRAA
jgi:hypothetical protein